MSRNGLSCHHSLIQVDDPESTLHHDLKLLRHELGLSPDPPLMVGVVDLCDPDLLFADVVLAVESPVLGLRDLPIRESANKLGPPLADGEADLLDHRLTAEDPGQLLIRELSWSPFILPQSLETIPCLGPMRGHLQFNSQF